MTLIQQLEQLRTLKDDCDGEGSPAPKPGLIDYALWLVATQSERLGIPGSASVSSSMHGGIEIEWKVPLGRYEQVEIDTVGVVDVFGCGDSQSYWHKSIEIPMEAVE